MIKNFRTYFLAVEFYRQLMVLKLPRHLQEQCQRAASSIALNLAEGAGRATKADQARFFNIAFGSLRECEAILDLVTIDSSVLDLADKLAAHIYKLIKHCRSS